ncbi:hypothetical protein OJF2_51480 [Aquisphaera giovannonii]|uniref:Uncharacterized protein n=1 Tax=Aquisphaera giovannonii TaxID=406548 RepID=A0A5B9W8J4_9BACT|nr:hypothetical protein [Aquisphaera giovannonii]QEH36564.1 hypothetical protein OJF2_51480 [Aquisphaera giovannonii]
MSAGKKLALLASFWLAMSAFTYGHAVKQFRAEERAECADDRKHSQNAPCSEDMVRFEALVASLFWPQHWSETLWSGQP